MQNTFIPSEITSDDLIPKTKFLGQNQGFGTRYTFLEKNKVFDRSTTLDDIQDTQLQKTITDDIRVLQQMSTPTERPNIPGVLLKELVIWVRENLDIGPQALGELCNELYDVYKKSETPGGQINRRSFPAALIYVLKIEFGAFYVVYRKKRPSSITNISFKTTSRF